MVSWPEPMVISEKVRGLKRKFVDVMGGSDEEDEAIERDLNYIVAVSSGKAVTEEIPKQIGRRAGWASQQGANFVEILIENPAQLIMDQDMLVNLASQLDLHYNIHSSTNLAYGMAYRVGRGNGYDRGHEYTVKLLKSIRRFKDALAARDEHMADDGYPRMYAVNAHMAVQEMPPEEERLATDVSVDPFGIEIRESKIFANPEARAGIFKHFIWNEQGAGDDVQEFAQILGNIDQVQDAQDYIQENLIDLLEQEGYISDDLLEFIATVRNADSRAAQLLQQAFSIPFERLRDLPSDTESLKNHVNGQSLAQQVATLSPHADFERIPEESPEQQLDKGVVRGALDELDLSVPQTNRLDLSTRDWDDMRERAQRAILNEDPDSDLGGVAYNAVVDFLLEDQEEAAEAMRNMARSRRLYQDEFNKESSIFRYLIPLWMPFAEQEQVRQIWEGITEKPVSGHEELVEWLYEGDDPAMTSPRGEEDVIAAATGAYVWGHFTQTPPGYERTVMELIKEADIYWSFEAHMAGDVENARIWKPKDFVEVVKAINSTPIEHVTGEGEEVTEPIPRTRVTIDMEHIATQKVDPMWVIDPGEEAQAEGYKGLDEGDGQLIMINHVTHPYIGEGGHHHGPVRRGDTLVYRYLYELIDSGMATDPVLPTVVMYEIGAEKAETLFMLRLILKMVEHDIEPDVLEGEEATRIINKDEPENLREYVIQKFFGVTDTEVQHEWQEIFEHALDPLDDLLEAPSGGHTWLGRAATESGTRPEEWQEEEYR